MPKKKEKGLGKSEEDRLLRAQAEQEMKRGREETLAQFLKNKVQAEQRNSAVNRQKLNDTWRDILRQYQEVELRTELVELQQGSERQLDELDSVVEKLVQEVQESENKTAQMQRAHQQHMESFWKQQNLQLIKLQQLWLQFLRDRNSTLTLERKHVLDESQRLRGKLDGLRLSAEQRDKDELDELHRLNEEMLQSYESAQQMSLCGKGLDSTDKDLNYRSAEEERNNKLSAKKENLKKTMEVLERQKVLAGRLKEKHSAAMMDIEEKVLTASISEVKQKYQQLQVHLNQRRKSAKEQLTRICVSGHRASKRLQAVIDKGEKILRVAEMCKKVESKHESLLSSVLPSPSSDEYKELRSSVALDSDQLEKLQVLMLRLSTSQLLVKTMNKEKNKLHRENEEMQLLLRQCSQHDSLDGHRSPLVMSRAPTSDQRTGRKLPSSAVQLADV